MIYRKKDNEKTREIELPSHITSDDKDSFSHIINDFVNSKNKIISLNFEKTVMIDSSGMGFLFVLLETCAANDKELIVKNMTKNIKKTFDVMNFEHMIDIIKGADI